MKILLATKNRNKLKEISRALENENIQLLSLNDFPDMPDVVEDSDTLEGNSLKKAKEIFEYSGITTLADDTGLEVDALNGAPGVYSARYAGEECSYKDNNIKLLKDLKGVPKEKRTARFRCVMTLFGKNIKEVREGKLEGEIIEEYKGNDGFGYDPIFLVPNFDKTLAEMTLDEKNKISHRGLALVKIVQLIKSLPKN